VTRRGVVAAAAGALAGTLTWADNNHCLADGESWVIYSLNQYQKWWREAFNAGFLASSEKLTAAKTTVGLSKTCELYIDPLKEDISGGSIQVGLWRFGVVPPTPFQLELIKLGIITPAEFAESAKRNARDYGELFQRIQIQDQERAQQESKERWERAQREPGCAPGRACETEQAGIHRGPRHREPDGNRNGMDATARTATPGMSLCLQGPGTPG
jgi:hypothetical protein